MQLIQLCQSVSILKAFFKNNLNLVITMVGVPLLSNCIINTRKPKSLLIKDYIKLQMESCSFIRGIKQRNNLTFYNRLLVSCCPLIHYCMVTGYHAISILFSSGSRTVKLRYSYGESGVSQSLSIIFAPIFFICS